MTQFSPAIVHNQSMQGHHDNPPVSYAPMFNFGDTETKGNAQRFATEQEAYDSAQDRYRVWTMPTGFFVAETNDPVNYRRENGADVSNTTNIIGD